jgi:hypothetical protein
MNRILGSTLILCLAMPLLVGSGGKIAEAQQQLPVGGGGDRFLLPVKGQHLMTHVPVGVSWTLDSPNDIESIDLLLSIDGGTTFRKLAGQLPPGQDRLTWSPSRSHASESARFSLLLRRKDGEVSRVLSDKFSIPLSIGEAPITLGRDPSMPPPPPRPVPPPNVKATRHTAEGAVSQLGGSDPGEGSREEPRGGRAGHPGIQPDVFAPGNCYNATRLDQIDSFDLECQSPPYFSEPASAFDPVTLGHCHTATGFQSALNTTNISIYGQTAAYSGLGFPTGYAPNGDITTEIGADGTVYVVSLARSSSGITSPDSIVIWRSTDSGTSFGAVPVPGLPGPFVDKPVISVHPGNRDVLAITLF